MRNAGKRAQADPDYNAYWNMNAKDRQFYELGQQALPSRVFSRLAERTPVGRGKILDKFSTLQRTMLNAQGQIELVGKIPRRLLGDKQFDYFSLLGTGLTPRGNLAFGENWISIIGVANGLFRVSDEAAAEWLE